MISLGGAVRKICYAELHFTTSNLTSTFGLVSGVVPTAVVGATASFMVSVLLKWLTKIKK